MPARALRLPIDRTGGRISKKKTVGPARCHTADARFGQQTQCTDRTKPRLQVLTFGQLGIGTVLALAWLMPAVRTSAAAAESGATRASARTVATVAAGEPLAGGQAEREATSMAAPEASAQNGTAETSASARAKLVRVLMLRDYNTRVVLLGTLCLGVTAGVVGTFTLLRKRALVGDVVSHAALPGIAAAFLAMEWLAPGSGKSLPALLAGALAAGLLAMALVIGLHRLAPIKDDAALAIVLSVFFGCGVALFTVVQTLPTGNQAGLQGFIFGKTASMVAADVMLIMQVALVVLVVCGLLFKELAVLCFDEGFAAAQGWPTTGLDVVLMTLVAVVTVIGLQSVGLLLVVALLIIPPAAARFWADRLGAMTLGAALLGGASTVGGATLSAVFPRLAAGAVIVLTATCFFLISLFASPRRGLVRRAVQRARLAAEIDRQHLLRALYECVESERTAASGTAADKAPEARVSVEQLLAKRTWKTRHLMRLLRRAERRGLLVFENARHVRLTETGWQAARRVARNHRLWELYLIQHAAIATARVDRYADLIEHVLEPEILAELEKQLATHYPDLQRVPPSPHALDMANANDPLADNRAKSDTGQRPRNT